MSWSVISRLKCSFRKAWMATGLASRPSVPSASRIASVLLILAPLSCPSGLLLGPAWELGPLAAGVATGAGAAGGGVAACFAAIFGATGLFVSVALRRPLRVAPMWLVDISR